MEPDLLDRDALKKRVRSATADMFEEIARLRMSVEERVASQSQRIGILEEELGDRGRHVQHLEGRVKALQGERDTARQELEAAGNVTREARERLLALEKDLHAARLEIQSFSAERTVAAAARSQIDGLARDVERLAREKDMLVARLAEIQDAGLLAERLGRLVSEARAKGAHLARAVETLKGFGAGAAEVAGVLGPLADSLQQIVAPIVNEAERGAQGIPPAPEGFPGFESAAARSRIDQLIQMIEGIEKKIGAGAQSAVPAAGAKNPLYEPATLKTALIAPRVTRPDEAIREAIERAFKNI